MESRDAGAFIKRLFRCLLVLHTYSFHGAPCLDGALAFRNRKNHPTIPRPASSPSRSPRRREADFVPRSRLENAERGWVLVKGLNLSYYNQETILLTVDPYYV